MLTLSASSSPTWHLTELLGASDRPNKADLGESPVKGLPMTLEKADPAGLRGIDTVEIT